MHLSNHALAGAAAVLPPKTPPSPVISVSPITLRTPDRRVDLEVRVTFPVRIPLGSTTSTAGSSSPPNDNRPLPIILLSHGHGPSNHLSSLEGYAPLAEFYAAHGFAVLQPTHLSSRRLGLPLDESTSRELFVDSRGADMHRLLDDKSLDEIEGVIVRHGGGGGGGSSGLDRTRVAVVGHSLGGFTACLLLGAANVDPRDGTRSEPADARIKAGVIFGAPGRGGADLAEAGKNMPGLALYGVDFGSMRAPALVVWGDEDVSPHLTVRGADWHLDPYNLAPGPKDAFMVRGGKHGFGGISGWDAAECQDESPERLAAVQRMSWAYLRSQLYEGDRSWEEACNLLEGLDSIGKVESK